MHVQQEHIDILYIDRTNNPGIIIMRLCIMVPSTITFFFILLLYGSFMAALVSSIDTSVAILIRVDWSGRGDYTKIQDAIDAVPSNNARLYFIWVKPGTYREKIVVPADKPYITLSGSGPSKTIVTWNEGIDIFKSATISVLAPYFVGQLLTIQNTFGDSAQAVALRVEGDLVAFYSCNIVSYQDTLLDDIGRHYYHNCYIEGATDFICGNGASLFERCHLHSTSKNNGSITAQHRDSALDNTGFTFYACSISSVAPAFLGRPWAAYSRVVFALTYMSNMILPQGWDEWNSNKSVHSTAYYGEYRCYGPGANLSKRVYWSKRLSHAEAVPFLNWKMLGGKGWLRPMPRKFVRPHSM